MGHPDSLNSFLRLEPGIHIECSVHVENCLCMCQSMTVLPHSEAKDQNIDRPIDESIDNLSCIGPAPKNQLDLFVLEVGAKQLKKLLCTVTPVNPDQDRKLVLS